MYQGKAYFVEDCYNWTSFGKHGMPSKIWTCSKQGMSKTPMSSLIFYCSGGLRCSSLKNNMGPPAMHEFAECVWCMLHVPAIPHSCSPHISVSVSWQGLGLHREYIKGSGMQVCEQLTLADFLSFPKILSKFPLVQLKLISSCAIHAWLE